MSGIAVSGNNSHRLRTSYLPSAQSVRQVMDRVFFLPLGHENKEGKNRGSITCRTDQANEANEVFIIWLC